MSAGREGISEKAARLLVNGAVRVQLATLDGRVSAQVVGDHGHWTVTRVRGGWSCSCPTWGACSHLTAVRLVTAPHAREAVPQ